MRQKKHLAALACLFFGLSGAFACPGCMAWDDAAWCADENPAVSTRWYVDRNADVSFAFSDDNRVAVSNFFWDGGGQVFSKSGTYRIEYKYGVPFIRFYWDAHNSPRAIGERFLMLRNEDFMVLYRDNTEPAFVAFRRWEVQGHHPKRSFMRAKNVSAPSLGSSSTASISRYSIRCGGISVRNGEGERSL